MEIIARSPAFHAVMGHFRSPISRLIRFIVVTRLGTSILSILLGGGSGLLGSQVFPRSLASFLTLSRVFAGQTKLYTVRTRVLAVTFRAQLIALVARATYPSPDGLAVCAARSSTFRGTGRLSASTSHSFRALAPEAFPLSHGRPVATQCMYGVLLLFLKLVQRIMRSLCQCVKPMVYEVLVRNRTLRDVVTMTEVVSIVHHLGSGIGIRQICVWRNY